MITIHTSRAVLQIVASLTDDSRGIIYNQNMLIVQATEENLKVVCAKFSTLS